MARQRVHVGLPLPLEILPGFLVLLGHNDQRFDLAAMCLDLAGMRGGIAGSSAERANGAAAVAQPDPMRTAPAITTARNLFIRRI